MNTSVPPRGALGVSVTPRAREGGNRRKSRLGSEIKNLAFLTGRGRDDEGPRGYPRYDKGRGEEATPRPVAVQITINIIYANTADSNAKRSCRDGTDRKGCTGISSNVRPLNRRPARFL